MMKVLVTGASGLSGVRFAGRLLPAPFRLSDKYDPCAILLRGLSMFERS